DRLDLCINSVENEIVDSSGCAKDSDGDGVIDRLDHCINSIQDEIVDKSGCAKDSDDDGFIDRLDNCPDSIKGAIVDEFGCEPKNTPKEKPIMTPVDTNISQEGENSLIIKFSYKSEELTQTSQEDIEGLINHLNKFPNDRIVMKSYTDSIGSARYNLKLSAKRSKSVLNILIDYGIDMKRVSIHNMGESSPIASNLLKSGREKNRRIEIKIIKFD
ncbi:MAG: OmpA family protein, partial [Campylobacterota bacterium]|nr:OmpA family protein [Campylobacterota bacterium]